MSISFARVVSGTATVAGTNAYSAYTPQPTLNTSQSGDLTGQDVSDFYLQVTANTAKLCKVLTDMSHPACLHKAVS